MSSLLLEPLLSPWIMAESMVSSLTLVVAAVNMTGVDGVFFDAGCCCC